MVNNIYEINNFQGNMIELVVDSNYYFRRCDDLSKMEAKKIAKEYLYDSNGKINMLSIESVYMDYSTSQVRIVLENN